MAPGFRAAEGPAGFRDLVSPRGCRSYPSGYMASRVEGRVPASPGCGEKLQAWPEKWQRGQAQRGHLMGTLPWLRQAVSCRGKRLPTVRPVFSGAHPGRLVETLETASTSHCSCLDVPASPVARSHGWVATASLSGGSPPRACILHLCPQLGSQVLGAGTHLMIGAEAVHLLLKHGHPQVFAQEFEDI